MIYKAFMLKYGEIGVKGKNRAVFEEALRRSTEDALSKVGDGFVVTRPNGRILAEAKGDYDFDEAVNALKKVFGYVSFHPAKVVDDRGLEDLYKEVISLFAEEYGKDAHATFKVKCKRGRKNYPLDSMELAAAVGEQLLNAFPGLSVDVHEPEIYVHVEIREKIYIYSKEFEGQKGLPRGVSGKTMLLLSGGIDSPVAGYRMARRGVLLEAVYFHAPPYTSERAKNKVVKLGELISAYTGPFKLHIVNFTDIQLKILDLCPRDELTIIMRRYMMRIAETLALETDCLSITTGESIGQVASQTMQSLNCTNAVTSLPVFRPLITYDKQEIMDESERIGTYETSVLPYEDCCTIFVAKHPVTKPRLSVIEKSEERLISEIEPLLEEALRTEEIVEIR
ncbi:MAG: tRNA 4-thiouridine(8) synthase ThiI [Lachnospiraceae bacterium]|nr:tRNA 4-thiouridine(8) synthase ThiI [Lachnospiraceae bacterium]MCR5212295.1 tRNA 4-thiouridine(8) synthase ThiI [Lachnospiraceae bacterium]